MMKNQVQEKVPCVSLWENEGGHIFEQNIKGKDQGLGISPKELWGEQTKKSLKYFNIGNDQFDSEFLKVLLSIKLAMADSNFKFNFLDKKRYHAIKDSIGILLNESNDDLYPVKIWQTGSGTQVNMNVNEVISSLANTLIKEQGTKVHPNDHVNMSQSSNDVIPSAMNLAVIIVTQKSLLPALQLLETELYIKEDEFKAVLKVGRTHMMDAVPMTLGQEISSFASQIHDFKGDISDSLEKLKSLPLGGTAVGTGINCPSELSQYALEQLSDFHGCHLKKMTNLFAGVSTSNSILNFSSHLKTLATIMTKLTTDLMLLSSGPHTGLNEITIPHNEAGSSIMPSKVNPTQCEALAMVCCQVIGNDLALSLGALQGRLQLNTFRPLMIRNIMHSLRILSGSIESFTLYCLKGIRPNLKVLEKNTENSKMMITLLTPSIGYEVAAKIVQLSEERGSTLKQEIMEQKLMTEEELNRLMSIEFLTSPPPQPHNHQKLGI